MNNLTEYQNEFIDQIDFEKSNGVVVVVVQDYSTKEVLMTAFANRHAIEKTLETSTMWYLSRERGLWNKGETSGNFQEVVSLHLDCDNDTILALVNPRGPACHNGTVTCFVNDKSYEAGAESDK